MDKRLINFQREATEEQAKADAGMEAMSPFCLLCKNTNATAYKNCTGTCKALQDYVAVIH